jgi:hypothetical protein
VCRHSSAGTATRYELDGPGIESWWEWDCLHPSRPALGLTHLLKWVPCLFQGVKRPGCGVNYPPHLALRLKKEKNYTCTVPLGLHGLYQGKLYLLIFLSQHRRHHRGDRKECHLARHGIRLSVSLPSTYSLPIHQPRDVRRWPRWTRRAVGL